MEKLKEESPNLERWQIFLLKKLPKNAAEILPSYLKWAQEAEKEVKRQERILEIALEFYDGKAWADLLREHPEFADKCDWSKLNDENWASLLQAQPQLAKYRPADK